MDSLNTIPAFAIEDIHKVREANYERQKHMSTSERMADNERRVMEACKLFGLPLSGKDTPLNTNAK